MNDLQIFVRKTLANCSSTARMDIVRALGYANFNKGLRRLNDRLDTLDSFEEMAF